MAVSRMERIDSEIQKTLSNIFTYEIKNPNLNNVFITVTSVKTTPDLKFCKVYLSIFPDNNKEIVFNEIKNCIPFIRKAVAKKINLRICPEFNFYIDDSLEYSKKMDDLFSKIKKGE